MKPTVLLILGSLLTQTAFADDGRQIRIRVQDYAGVSPKTRSEAFAVAAQIFASAGVSLVWLDCSANQAGPVDERCERRLNGEDIILRLIPEKMEAATGLKAACLGYAILPRNGFGTMAAVFVDRARREAERALASRSAVLGHAVAHEIAHLLIGNAKHAPQGLMQAVWSRSDLLRATASPMVLTDGENRAITDNLRARRLHAHDLPADRSPIIVRVADRFADGCRSVTQAQRGDVAAEEELLRRTYRELKRIAGAYMREERPGHTLQPTALVHEAYLRLAGQERVEWRDRRHFFGLAARMMRRVLVALARERLAEKRGGGQPKLVLDWLEIESAPAKLDEILAVDHALDRLTEIDPRQSTIVELYYFGGLSIEETAAALDISPRTVDRDWAMAQAWLRKQLADSERR